MHGAPWNAEGVAFFEDDRAFVLFDLGKVFPIAAVYLQGDNNDRFLLEVSSDGRTFTKLWEAPAVGALGLQPRWTKNLGARGRFVRLSAIGGDRWISLSEVQLFSSKPAIWPPVMAIDQEMTPSLWAQLSLLIFIAVAVVTMLRHRRRTRADWIPWLLTGVAAVGVGIALLVVYPPDSAVVNLSRAVAATVGAAVVLRLGFRPDGGEGRASTALLAAMAAFSMLAFYNFGHPQFYDAAQHKPTYVHTFDLRVYFPAAKYLKELGFDGVYLASVKAYADQELDGSLEPIAQRRMRDLRDYELRTISELSPEIHAVKDRFTPERWEKFQRDMAYFWKTMGRKAYLDSLRDHGANATPAWLLVAHWIYGSTEARESTFLWVGLLDPLLLALFFAVAWRTFGVHAALVCMIAFGATSVYQFGSNWAGSTLRNDWMFLLGVGVCALHSQRWVLAGMLLGWAAMIRAFPALALAFLIVPIGWQLIRARKASSPDDRRHAEREEVAPLLKVVGGALTAAVVLGALSTATFGFDESWGAWARKIAMHANRPNVNHLGLTALVSFDPDNLWHALRERGEDPALWQPLTAQAMRDRWWIIAAGMIAYTGLAIAACRRLRLSDAAVIGTMMIPIYFYPSNYYLHILFIWPLLLAGWSDGMRGREWAAGAAVVLIGCAIQWFGWLIPGNYGQFLFWSGVLLVMILALLLIPIFGDRRLLESPPAARTRVPRAPSAT